MMEIWRGTGDPRVASPPLSTKLSADWHCGMGRGTVKGRSPLQWELRKLRPYDRSRCAEHGVSCSAFGRGVPATPGVVMVASPEGPRNAEGGAKRRPRCLTGAG
jgi:hypothetical protein